MLIYKPEGKWLSNFFGKFKSDHFLKKPWILKIENNYYKIYLCSTVFVLCSEGLRCLKQMFKYLRFVCNLEGKLCASLFGEIQVRSLSIVTLTTLQIEISLQYRDLEYRQYCLCLRYFKTHTQLCKAHL